MIVVVSIELLLFIPWVVVQSLPVPFKVGARPFNPDFRVAEAVNLPDEDVTSTPPPAPGRVLDLPGYGPLEEKSYAGYVRANNCGAYLYFWLVESRRDPIHDPLVIWLQGGPGSSSFLGAMNEMGPYLLDSSGNISRNPYSWNRKATFVIFDQPSGTGASFVESRRCYAAHEGAAMDELYHGVKELLITLPQYREVPLYVFGESYGGKYVPELAVRMLADDNRLGLAGIGIGDGWVNPRIQQQSYAHYAYSHGLITHAEHLETEELQRICLSLYHSISDNSSSTRSDWRGLDQTCGKIEAFIVDRSGGVNVFDIRQFGDYDKDTAVLTKFLNTASVRKALRIDPRAGPWTDTDDTVAFLLEAQEQWSSAHLFPSILSQVPVLVYNGIYDMDCNFMGTDAWLAALGESWIPGSNAYHSAHRQPWRSNDGLEMFGHGLSLGNLTQLLVLDAGHLVPMGAPKPAAEMVENFLVGKSPFETQAKAAGQHTASEELVVLYA